MLGVPAWLPVTDGDMLDEPLWEADSDAERLWLALWEGVCDGDAELDGVGVSVRDGLGVCDRVEVPERVIVGVPLAEGVTEEVCVVVGETDAEGDALGLGVVDEEALALWLAVEESDGVVERLGEPVCDRDEAAWEGVEVVVNEGVSDCDAKDCASEALGKSTARRARLATIDGRVILRVCQWECAVTSAPRPLVNRGLQ